MGITDSQWNHQVNMMQIYDHDMRIQESISTNWILWNPQIDQKQKVPYFYKGSVLSWKAGSDLLW